MRKYLYSSFEFIALFIMILIGNIIYLKIENSQYINWQYMFAIFWGGTTQCLINAIDEVKKVRNERD